MSNLSVSAQLAEIYILMCRSALNKEYYGKILSRTLSLNYWSDIFIAIGTTGSGLSALTVWSTGYGKIAWGVLTVLSALFAMAKPVAQLNKRIDKLTKLYAGHSDNYSTLLMLVSRIKRHGVVSEEMSGIFESAELRFVELSKDDDPKPNYRLLQQCEEVIRKRHPTDSAWYPTEISGLKT